MGNFYSSIVLRGVMRQGTADALRMMKRRAFVSPEARGVVVVYDADSEEGGLDTVSAVAQELSDRLACVAFAVVNHDDDFLACVLCVKGEEVDRYLSVPDYFDDDAPTDQPVGGDASVLARAFDRDNAASAINRLLRKGFDDDDGFVFEIERHQALAKLLNLPEQMVCLGYAYLEAGDLPDGVSVADFTRIG